MNYEQSSSLLEFADQGPLDGGCTANSLANLTSLMLGYNIPEAELADLRQRAEANRARFGLEGLTAEDRVAFLESHGLRYEYLGNSLSENADDSNAFLAAFLERLRQAPISFALSSALTMHADPRTMSGTTESGSRGITHQVVAAMKSGESEAVRIVDPYNPGSELNTYPLQSMDAMFGLLVTVTSAAGQRPNFLGNRSLTRDNIQRVASEALLGTNPSTFIRTALSINEMYTASFASRV